MAIDDVYKVTLSATGQGSIYQNVFNLQCKLALDPTNADFALFASDWRAVFQPNVTNQITYTGWAANQQWGPNMTIDQNGCRRLNGKQFAAAILGQAGQASGDMLPPQDAAVVTWLTGTAGRRKRGRTYQYGLLELYQADGLWTTTMVGNWTTALNTFLAKYHANSGTSTAFRLGVWSERTASGCVPVTPPNKGHINVDNPHPELAFTGITALTLRDIVRVQRRRERGVGR